MLHRPSHDDRMRTLRARLSAVGQSDALPAADRTEQSQNPNGTKTVPLAPPLPNDDPVQLSRPMIDAAILRSAQLVKTSPPIKAVRPGAMLPRGAVSRFLATARTLQRLPSFGGRMRE